MAENCGQCILHSGQVEKTDNLVKGQDLIISEIKEIVHSMMELSSIQNSQQKDMLIMGEKVDKMESLTESVTRMSVAVEAGNAISVEILGKLEKHDGRIGALEDAPSGLALSAWKYIIFAVGGMIVMKFIDNLPTIIKLLF